jgi:hypothetical protein
LTYKPRAERPEDAIQRAKELARADGRRVRTLVSARLEISEID